MFFEWFCLFHFFAACLSVGLQGTLFFSICCIDYCIDLCRRECMWMRHHFPNGRKKQPHVRQRLVRQISMWSRAAKAYCIRFACLFFQTFWLSFPNGRKIVPGNELFKLKARQSENICDEIGGFFQTSRKQSRHGIPQNGILMRLYWSFIFRQVGKYSRKAWLKTDRRNRRCTYLFHEFSTFECKSLHPACPRPVELKTSESYVYLLLTNGFSSSCSTLCSTHSL